MIRELVLYNSTATTDINAINTKLGGRNCSSVKLPYCFVITYNVVSVGGGSGNLQRKWKSEWNGNRSAAGQLFRIGNFELWCRKVGKLLASFTVIIDFRMAADDDWIVPFSTYSIYAISTSIISSRTHFHNRKLGSSTKTKMLPLTAECNYFKFFALFTGFIAAER